MQNSEITDLERLAAAAAGRPNEADFLSMVADRCWAFGDRAAYAEFFRRSFVVRLTESFGDRIDRAGPDEVRDIRDRMQALVEHGVRYSPVLTDLTRAETKLANLDAVNRLVGDSRVVLHSRIAPPVDASLEAFNRAIAAELKTDLAFYEKPRGRAIRKGLRREHVHNAKTPALRSLMKILHTEVERYIALLPDEPANHFIAARPSQYVIGGWAVISTSESYHANHVHPRAWATGVYYVSEPEISKAPASKTGWLYVGPPSWAPKETHAYWFQKDIAPIPGSFVVMPGHYWHGTTPMGVDQERICVAFEVQPQELRNAKAKSDGRDSPD